ncbi:Swt1 family HEPN domain-containing protein [Candidatus Bathyarchaeota archaeon]|nr:Swt1 family HEPN domain-containing protein [Candidatus Bathyarchaeota archaeon]
MVDIITIGSKQTTLITYESMKEPLNIHDEVPYIPSSMLLTYARLWQLETWLRHMVYVELKARDGDRWSDGICSADKPRKADKSLTHMPTPETEAVSYIYFSELMKLISENWKLFSAYLLPENIWNAKIEELSQIRNRIAHFRKGHSDDLQRVKQLLRDIDKGFWLFCTSYNDTNPVLPQNEDAVTSEFIELDPFPYTQLEEGKWGRVGSAPPEMKFMVTIEIVKRLWADPAPHVDGSQGYLYDACISARHQRSFDYRRLLEDTRVVHPHLVYLCLDKFVVSVRITIPAVLGSKRVIELIKKVIKVAEYTINPYQRLVESDDSVQRLADEWPEFILGPENPLTYLGPDMPCVFFAA